MLSKGVKHDRIKVEVMLNYSTPPNIYKLWFEWVLLEFRPRLWRNKFALHVAIKETYITLKWWSWSSHLMSHMLYTSALSLPNFFWLFKLETNTLRIDLDVILTYHHKLITYLNYVLSYINELNLIYESELKLTTLSTNPSTYYLILIDIA